jgi:hypothetical protein
VGIFRSADLTSIHKMRPFNLEEFKNNEETPAYNSDGVQIMLTIGADFVSLRRLGSSRITTVRKSIISSEFQLFFSGEEENGEKPLSYKDLQALASQFRFAPRVFVTLSYFFCPAQLVSYNESHVTIRYSDGREAKITYKTLMDSEYRWSFHASDSVWLPCRKTKENYLDEIHLK